MITQVSMNGSVLRLFVTSSEEPYRFFSIERKIWLWKSEHKKSSILTGHASKIISKIASVLCDTLKANVRVSKE